MCGFWFRVVLGFVGWLGFLCPPVDVFRFGGPLLLSFSFLLLLSALFFLWPCAASPGFGFLLRFLVFPALFCWVRRSSPGRWWAGLGGRAGLCPFLASIPSRGCRRLAAPGPPSRARFHFFTSSAAARVYFLLIACHHINNLSSTGRLVHAYNLPTSCLQTWLCF